jgi:hypothetical protein
VSGIANVTSPPYDVISGGSLAHLRAADPHNVVRLILPGEGADAPAAAASLLARWLSDGVLIQDRMPALYLYEQAAPSWRQRGIIGLVRLGDPDSAGILPHEGVMPGPVAGRRKLMAATKANLEPIFLVYDGAGSDGGAAPGSSWPAATATEILDKVADGRTPLLSIQTEDGVTHRLWRVDDPVECDQIVADLAGRRALIADGHHRYAAYLQLQAEMRAAGHGDGPWDYGLAFLVDSAASPPRLGAIHRVLPGLTLDRAVALAASAFMVDELPAGTDLETALGRLAEEKGTAFLLAGGGNRASYGGRGGGEEQVGTGEQAGIGEQAGEENLSAGNGTRYRLLSRPDPAQAAASMPPGVSGPWQGLDASIMQQLLLGRLWGITDNEDDGRDLAARGRHARPGRRQAQADGGHQGQP